MTRSSAIESSSAVVSRPLGHQCVVHRCDDLDPAPLGQDAGNMQNLAGGALNRKIPNCAPVDGGRALHVPTDRRADFQVQSGVIQYASGPRLEHPKSRL